MSLLLKAVKRCTIVQNFKHGGLFKKDIANFMAQATTTSRIIKATPEAIYNAFINPVSLETWQVPGDMKAKVHHFDLKIGGGYQMSLFYPDSENEIKGKTTAKEDKYTARFIDIQPNKKIVEVIQFDTTNPDFAEEMIIEITFDPLDTATRVTFVFKNIPKGIRPDDNEAGTISSLEKLARYVEAKPFL